MFNEITDVADRLKGKRAQKQIEEALVEAAEPVPQFFLIFADLIEKASITRITQQLAEFAARQGVGVRDELDGIERARQNENHPLRRLAFASMHTPTVNVRGWPRAVNSSAI